MILWLSRAWRALKRKLRLIDCFREEWRKVSTWILAFGASLFGFIAAFPEAATAAWHMVPEDLRAQVPYQREIAMGIIFAAFLAKFVKQKPRGEG